MPRVSRSVEDTFADRTNYQEVVLERVTTRTQAPGIVFLDPDTGLQSRSPGLEHILDTEITELWKHLQIGDVLVVYQHHTNRAGLPWMDAKKAQFERSLEVSPGVAKIARAEGIARDVALFYVQKVR